MGDADAEGFFFDATTCSLATLLGFQTTLELLEAVEARPPSLNCYGLHEWAMQYQPEGSPPPPSAVYQAHAMPLRVDRGTINAVVERRGIR